jgi:hypothetical protein
MAMSCGSVGDGERFSNYRSSVFAKFSVTANQDAGPKTKGMIVWVGILVAAMEVVNAN